MADTEQNLDSLLERSSGTDVPLLLKAKEDAKRRVKDDPSATNLAALNRATQMLREAMSNQNGNQKFEGVKDVLAYLQSQGRKVSQSQVYKDLKRGYLRRRPDGSFSQRDVDLYASTLKVYALPEKEGDAMSELARQELEEKVAKTREQRLAISFERKVKEGKYILREEVALELAGRGIRPDVICVDPPRKGISAQVIEAIGKLVVGLALAFLIIHTTQNVAMAAGGAIIGVTIGSALALVYMLAKFRRS